jgi:outer membrane protein OmpA-like peptidoglycan-associated protein
MWRIILILFYCVLSSVFASAQKVDKAGRCYNEALVLKSKKQTDKACKMMEQSIELEPTSPDAYSLLGEWYFEQHKFTEAANVFRKASARCQNGGMRFSKPLTRSLMYSGQPDNALFVINNYATIKDSADWNRMRRQTEFIKSALSVPTVAEEPVNMGIRVNSADPELFPSMAVDTQNLYFTRRVNNIDEDFYHSLYDSCGGWLYARNMGEPTNTPNQESAQFISADGHYLFFCRCENRSLDGWSEGGCDLFMSYRISNDSAWVQAVPFGATINTPAYEGMPSLSPDNRELYFVSDREGGFGGYDIWISRFENGLWQLPVNAGPNINTSGNETAPYINVDNQTFYFTSDGWPGMGGTDIFMSRKINDSTFTRAANLGYPINTAFDEKSECVTLDGKKLYFASDRVGPAGNYDLYETALAGNEKPIPVSYVYGIVYDSLTRANLNYAPIFVCNVPGGDTIYRFQSNRGDGSYLITLHLGHTYVFHTYRSGYSPVTDTIVFDKQYLQQPLVHNIMMLPADYVAPINDSLLATLHFDVNRVELSDSDKATIRNVIAPWVGEKSFMIYVNAYTDNTGTPMINEQLSTQRANQVTKYILTTGIDETVIHTKGWGESNMIANNNTPEGQKKNRRVEIIVRR